MKSDNAIRNGTSMQNTSLYHVNTLLDNARFIVVELCRDA